ncbi:MAG: GIY-YIG nuclease family protein, partial [Pseudomonadota bacterium]|nr:GIY-YIG nuclease family protein [Pseudomonadota bacterium]
ILTESEKADTKEFLNEILSILPLVEIRVFEKSKKIKVATQLPSTSKNVQDTIVVPAQEEGFNDVFLGENCWYAIRIGGGKLKDIKYIAAYQTSPISEVTHFAEVESIEPYGDGGKYRLNFVAPAKPIGPIKFGKAKKGVMQSPRYTSYEKLISAKELMDLFN